MRMQIGFLGLGTMGAPLANNLRKAGHEISVWNRTRERCEALAAKGAKVAPTPRDCAAGKDLVFTCLADEAALEAVLSGPDGVLEGLSAGSVLVDTSTSGLAETRAMETRVRQRGGNLVAAPLLGSKPAAEKAQVIIVAGGPAGALERARPALHAICARLIELDTAEHAALMKLVVNAVGGAMITGFAEALALGASGGLEIAQMVETVQASGFHSPFFLMKGEQIVKGDYAPRFAVRLAEKDQRLAQEAAAECGARLPVNAAVRRLLQDTIESGRGDKDLCAVADLVLEWARVKRSS